MENQVNIGDQNAQQIGQNPVNQPVFDPEKPKANYLMIGGVILVCFLLFGFGGYYLGKQTSKPQQVIKEPPKEATPTVFMTPTTANNSTVTPSSVLEPTSTWKTYTSNKYGFTFKYPQNYQVEERVDGFFVITAPGEHVPQGGISIDARLQGIYQTFEKAEDWINTDLAISQTSRLGSWSIFVGVGKEGMIKGIEFKQAITPYKSGAIGLETINNDPYKNIFEEVVKSFRFTN